MPPFADDHALVALALAVDVHVNVNQILVGTLFETFDYDGNAVRDLLAHEEQRFFAHKLGHEFFFRHIGKGVVVKIMGPLVAVGLQQGKQIVAAGAILGRDRDNMVKTAKFLDLLFAGFQRGKIIEQIDLIDDSNRRAAFLQGLDHGQLRVGQLPGRLKQHHGHVNVFQAGGSGLGHAGVQLVAGGVDAGRVHQHILHRAFGDNAGDAAAGRLRLLGHDSDLLAHKVVGQAGFAHVRPAYQCYKDTAGHFRNRFCHSVVRLSVLNWKNGK